MREPLDFTYVNRRAFLASLVGLSFLPLTLSRTCAQPQFAPFSFVYITGTHVTTGMPDLGFKLLQESQLFLQESIKSINSLKPDFVVFGGDQVEQVGPNETNWQLFTDLAQGLNSPWTFVLGERDISGKTYVNKQQVFGPDWKAHGLNSNTSYWSLNPIPEVHLIGLDSSVANSSRGDIPQEQLDWLKADLRSNQGKFSIVFCHHPLLPPAPYDSGPPWDEYVIPNGDVVREILGTNSDVRLVVSGHVYVNKIQIEKDIYHVSCSAMDTYPCQYKLFRVTPDSITIESYVVPFPALVKKAKKLLQSSTLAYNYNNKNPDAIIDLCEGNKEDQNALLSLNKAKSIQPLSLKHNKPVKRSKVREPETPKTPTFSGKNN